MPGDSIRRYRNTIGFMTHSRIREAARLIENGDDAVRRRAHRGLLETATQE